MFKQARSLLAVVLLLIASFMLALKTRQSSAASSSLSTDLPHHKNAVYVAPANDLLVRQEFFEELGVKIVPSYNDLVNWEQSGNEVRIIYLHPDAMGNIDEHHLQEAYQNSVVIAALNTPFSRLARAMNAAPSLEDLRPEYYTSDKHVTAAMMFRIEDSDTGRVSEWNYHDFFLPEHFDAVPRVIEAQLNEWDGVQIQGSCPSPSPNLDIKTAQQGTTTGLLTGIGWTRIENDGLASVYADTYHDVTVSTMRGHVEIWNNCDYVHEISNRTETQYWTQQICRVQTSAVPSGCAYADFWANTEHSAQPRAGDPWTAIIHSNIMIAD